MAPLRVRWVKAVSLVLMGCGAAVALEHSDARATETVYTLKSIIFAVVALLCAHPYVLAVANATTALLLMTVRDVERTSSKMVLQLSRSAGHLEALFTWLALAVWWGPVLDAQIAAVLAVIILGPLALDTLAARREAGRWRAFVPAGVTLVGLTLLVLTDPAQWRGLLPLVAAVLAGLAPRTFWSAWRGESLYPRAPSENAWAPFVDRLILGIAAAALVIVPLRALRPGHKASLENRIRRIHTWLTCNPPTTSPPPFALFVVADNQFHALDGKRSGFHMDLVDTEVPVSVRPVELDLLSAATLRSFASTYRAMLATRPQMRWAHLGDGADIGCVSELERFIDAARLFGEGDLAAVIPGNHDGTFLGNLSWHPDWDAACPGGRSNERHARERLSTLMPDASGRQVHRAPSFLASVTTLGALGSDEVVGVFLDTTDTPRDRVGVAGAQGGISEEQAAWVEATVAQRSKPSRILVFGHHPIDQWTPLARAHLERLARSLGARLWAVISAHTHLAATRDHELGGRVVPELIVGSTIDAPQEAAILEGSLDEAGAPVLRMRTIQAVKRPSAMCEDDDAPTTTAETCRGVFARLSKLPECRALFEPSDQERAAHGPPDACEKSASTWSPVLETGLGHVESPSELECLQDARAERLLECVGVPNVGAAPLADARLPQRVLASSDRDPAEMICLSWAASILQAHKREHWGMAQAIAFALDPSATWGTFEARWPR